VKTRELGRTGIQVRPICLGTMMFGRVANTDQDPCVRIILRALDSGINLVDTADVYSRSESEEIVGKALRGRRDECWPPRSTGRWGEDPNRGARNRHAPARRVQHAAGHPTSGAAPAIGRRARCGVSR
jgi:hypothetical protein